MDLCSIQITARILISYLHPLQGFVFLAFSHRPAGSSSSKPYFKLDWEFPRSHKPASGVSSYESSAQPGGSLGTSDPSYPDGSSETLKPAALTPGAGGYRESDGQLDGFNVERSVSHYKTGPLIYSIPGKIPLQLSYQNNLDVNGAPQAEGSWDFLSPQIRKVN